MCLGSGSARIIKYDVFAGGQYHTKFLECDALVFPEPGKVIAVEVKSGYNPSHEKAQLQLLIRAPLLKKLFFDVSLLSITINFQDINSDGFIELNKDDLIPFDEGLNNISLSLGDILIMAEKKGLDVDLELMKNAHIEAIQNGLSSKIKITQMPLTMALSA
jgi:hypothetical protein